MYDYLYGQAQEIYALGYGPHILSGCLIILIVGFIISTLLPFLQEQVAIQKIHRTKTSWIHLTYASMYLLSLGFSLALIHLATLYGRGSLNIDAILVTALTGLFVIVLFNTVNTADIKPSRFGPGSIGISEDKLDFRGPARKFAQTIWENKSNICVISLNNWLGMGKSSFIKMTLEHLCDPEITNGKGASGFLYTHISLVESNEKEDFSKLFAKRWSETLYSRYPSISPGWLEGTDLLETIMRDSGDGSLIHELMKIISKHFNEPIWKTRNKTSRENCYVTPDIAGIFQNIPEIIEDVWIIVIEDIERSHLSEIHRIIEVIERFRHEGQSGLPVKLVFILPYSREELENRLTPRAPVGTREFTAISNDPDAEIIRAYFITDPKFFDYQWHLPTVSPDIKRSFVIGCLPRKWTGYSETLVKRMIDKIKKGEWYFNMPSAGKTLDESNALGYLIANFLWQESPRSILKIVKKAQLSAERLHIGLGNKFGLPNMPLVRFCDLVGITYLEMKFPKVVDLWRDHAFGSPNSATKDFLETSSGEKQIRVSPDVAAILESDSSFKSSNAKELIYLVFGNTLQKDEAYYVNHTLEEPNSFSNKSVLRAYFQLGGVHDVYVRLRMFLNSKMKWEHVEQDEIYEFALILSTTRNVDFKSHYINCAHRLLEVMTSDRDAERQDGGVFHFYSLLNACYEVDASQINLSNIASCLKLFFANKNLPLSSLLKMLSSTRSMEGGVLQAFGITEVTEWAEIVLLQVKERIRLKGSAYKNGGGRMHSWLWNIWSGDPESTNEILQLRAIAEDINGIKDLESWWSLLPLLPENPEFKKISYGNDELLSLLDHMKIIFPIEKLISITKKHSGFKKQKKLSQKVKAWEKMLETDLDFQAWLKKPVLESDTIAKSLIKNSIIELKDLSFQQSPRRGK